MNEKPLRDYWQPNEASRFDRLYDLSEQLLAQGDALKLRATLARVQASKHTEELITDLLQAISVERQQWLALAKERMGTE